MSRPRLRLCLDDLAGDPAADTALARVLLEGVEAGELPATLRLSRPGRVVAFSTRDTRNPGLSRAVAAAEAQGFASVVRLAGGQPAVFTPATLAFSLAESASEPASGITQRFRTMASALRDALAAVGVDARIGAVPGEYCPGDWSVNHAATRKVAGIGQRLLRRSAHTGGVVVVGDAAPIRDVLTAVYAAMDLDWDPASVGQAVDGWPSPPTDPWTAVRDAIVAAFAVTHDLEPWPLDDATLLEARARADDHRLHA